jgi:hypothetical protein
LLSPVNHEINPWPAQGLVLGFLLAIAAVIVLMLGSTLGEIVQKLDPPRWPSRLKPR